MNALLPIWRRVVSQLTLGANVTHQGDIWRVVRVVSDDLSLFESSEGAFVIKDSYAMIKSPSGQLDFLVFATERTPYLGPTSGIKALESLPWRKS